MSRPLVLVIQHGDDDPPDRFGAWLVEAGCDLEVRRPYAGDAVPSDLAAYDALLVMGGSMNAHDDDLHAWLGPTKALLRSADADDVPALGICLGHQLAAAAFGGTSAPNPRGQQVGLYDVGWAEGAQEDPLLGAVAGPRRGVQWNHDVVDPPPGAVVLAATPAGEVQAARHRPWVWGVQLHPEADRHMVESWAEEEYDDLLERGVDVESVLGEIDAARDELDIAWAPLAGALARLAAATHERRQAP